MTPEDASKPIIKSKYKSVPLISFKIEETIASLLEERKISLFCSSSQLKEQVNKVLSASLAKDLLPGT